jgi:hypothetical protein
MDRAKKTRNTAVDPLPENVREPVLIHPKKRGNIIVFLAVVFAALVVLVYALYGLYTGCLLTIDKITLLYGKVLSAPAGNVVSALLSFFLALALLIYGVYGLWRGGIRNIIPTRHGIRDRTYYQGLAMWVMFLSFLSLSVYLIASAVPLVTDDRPLYAYRSTWKWMDAHNVPLFLFFLLLFVAGWLDDAIGGGDIRDALAKLRERFG